MKIYCSSCDKVQPVLIDDCRDAKTNEPFQDIVCADCHLVIASGTDISSEYERGFIDGMQKQMQSSVDRAVNRMADAHLVSLKRDMKKTLEDAAVRATHKVMAELEHDEHGPECSPEEFLLRGILASELKCWHRLTGDEAQNLVDFLQTMPASFQEKSK